MAALDRWISDLIGTCRQQFTIFSKRLVDDTINSRINIVDENNPTNYQGIGVGSVVIRDPVSGFFITIQTQDMTGESSYSLSLPTTQAAAGQVLGDPLGNGVLDWITVATDTNASKTIRQTVNFNDASPINAFTPPTGAVIKQVSAKVNTVFDDAAAEMSVGTNASPAAYMGAGESKLDKNNMFQVAPFEDALGAPDAVEIALSPGTSTQGSFDVFIEYCEPA